ncbi:glutathione S-transferase kappa 1-like [Dysidea avara]|uniref:glutathione S-transferase kappa 1-like n=1 Tax=Dysidea avara TaxID=196820 RepID=UPI00332B32FF
MTQQIKLYYNVMSPYSWIGFEVLHRYKQKWDLHLQLCPFQILKVREQSNNLPKSKEKAIHVGYDITRLAKFYNIPLKPPSNPTETLMGQYRLSDLLTAANLELPDKVEAISWMRVWSRACVKIGISNEKSKKLLARCKNQDVINKLKATAQEAFKYGVFGAPFMVVGKDNPQNIIFWGSDRNELIGYTLGKYPVQVSLSVG